MFIRPPITHPTTLDLPLIDPRRYPSCAAISLLFVATACGADSEQAGIPRVGMVLESPVVSEGGSATLALWLEFDPVDPVKIDVAAANDGLEIDPATLVIEDVAPRVISVRAGVDRDEVDALVAVTAAVEAAGSVESRTLVVTDTTELTRVGAPDLADERRHGVGALAGGSVLSQRVELAAEVSVRQLGYVGATSGGMFSIAVYRDAAGRPGELELAMDAPVAAYKAGAIEVDVAETTLASGSYWIALRGSPVIAPAYVVDGGLDSATCFRRFDLPDLAMPWPATFGSADCTVDDVQAGVYLVARRELGAGS